MEDGHLLDQALKKHGTRQAKKLEKPTLKTDFNTHQNLDLMKNHNDLKMNVYKEDGEKISGRDGRASSSSGRDSVARSSSGESFASRKIELSDAQKKARKEKNDLINQHFKPISINLQSTPGGSHVQDENKKFGNLKHTPETEKTLEKLQAKDSKFLDKKKDNVCFFVFQNLMSNVF